MATSGRAFAFLDIDAGLGSAGNIAITGGVNVVALAGAGSGATNATASASADIQAQGDVVITANLTKTIAVAAIAQSLNSNAIADGTLDIVSTGGSLDLVGDIAVLVSAGAGGSEDADANLTLSAFDAVSVQFINAPPTAIARSVGGDPRAIVQLTQTAINEELLVDLIPPFTVVLNDIQPGSVFDASATLNFGGDASITLCTLVGICVITPPPEPFPFCTLNPLACSAPAPPPPPKIPGLPPPPPSLPDITVIEPDAGPVDFFSTGEGGFLVDSTGNVTFSDLAPEPGTGPGNNACGVVISCPAVGEAPPGQSGAAPGKSKDDGGDDGDDDD